MALASSALTALIPLSIILGSVLAGSGYKDTAQRIIDRYSLTGGGADAVNHIFGSAPASASVNVVGAVFLLISVLSFTRAVQRLFEQTWELEPLSVRNTANGLLWAVALTAYVAGTGWLDTAFGGRRLGLAATSLDALLTAVFLVWGGWMLTAKRVTWRGLLPFGVIGAILTAVYVAGATVYLPHMFSSFATRYGAVGAVFAMISALFGAMLVFVGSAALGREVYDELDRVRHGERPPDDEVRREWDNVLEQMRLKWRTAREQISHHRPPKEPKQP